MVYFVLDSFANSNICHFPFIRPVASYTSLRAKGQKAGPLADRQNGWILADRQNGTSLAGLARSAFPTILGTLVAFCKENADAKRANAEQDSQFQKIPLPPSGQLLSSLSPIEVQQIGLPCFI